jgi:hypothetical protein
MLAADSDDGCERNIRECLYGCGWKRVTVIPPNGLPWREWQDPNGKIVRGATPPCIRDDMREVAA